ncbi:MAG: prohibitin family protein [Bryobacteraceae bacterium]
MKNVAVMFGSHRKGAAILLIALLIIPSTLTVISPGQVGVKVLFGALADGVLEEGLHLVNPLARIEKLSVRTETYTMNGARGDDAISVMSSDGVTMPMDISIVYRLAAPDAPWVYRTVGKDYVAMLLRPAARSAIPEAVSKYTFQDAYSHKREELVETMRLTLAARIRAALSQRGGFSGAGVVVQDVYLRRIQLPENLKDAIEQKMRSEQEAERMAFVLQREEREAERKRIEARGIRDFQSIVTEGISDKLLQWKGIEATETLAKSPNAKIVIVGSGKGGLPVILNPGS